VLLEEVPVPVRLESDVSRLLLEFVVLGLGAFSAAAAGVGTTPSTSSAANGDGDARKWGRLAWKIAGTEYVYSSSNTSCGGCGLGSLARFARMASFDTLPSGGEP